MILQTDPEACTHLSGYTNFKGNMCLCWNGLVVFHHDDVIKWKHFRVTGPLCGEFTGDRSFDVFFVLCLNKRWGKQSKRPWFETPVRLQNLPWSKTGLVSRQVLHPLSKLQNWIWSKTGRYKTGLVSNTKIEASLRATKPKPWQSNLASDTVEIFIQNEKAGLVPIQSRFRSRHKAGFGAAGLGTAQSWFWSRHKASFGAVSRPV